MTNRAEGNDMIRNPIRLRKGECYGIPGVYWAWPIDGYYDLHHADEGGAPDGSDVVGEFYATLKEAREAARYMANMNSLRL